METFLFLKMVTFNDSIRVARFCLAVCRTLPLKMSPNGAAQRRRRKKNVESALFFFSAVAGSAAAAQVIFLPENAVRIHGVAALDDGVFCEEKDSVCGAVRDAGDQFKRSLWTAGPTDGHFYSPGSRGPGPGRAKSSMDSVWPDPRRRRHAHVGQRRVRFPTNHVAVPTAR